MPNFSPYKHIIESQQFTKEFLEEIFDLTRFMKVNEHKVTHELKGKITALIFYEASTRTRMSFEGAILRLGGAKIHTENAHEFSSAAKGETLEDTIRTISSYCDFLVLRHNDNNSAEIAAKCANIPMINAGSGTKEHPTQALLDVYTILEIHHRLNNLSFAIVGDLLRGRTCNSLIYLLSEYPQNHFYFVSPANSKVKEDIREHLRERSISFEETEDLNSVLKKIDVVYMTRVQEERFTQREEYENARGKFILDANKVQLMKKESSILHPFPRVDEISKEVDKDPRAKYFQQIQNGLYIRMAILKILKDNT